MADSVSVNLIDDYIIEEMQVHDQLFRGDELISVEPPANEFPAWKIGFERGDGPKVLVATHVPVMFMGVKRPRPIVEEAEVEPSADE